MEIVSLLLVDAFEPGNARPLADARGSDQTLPVPIHRFALRRSAVRVTLLP